MWGIKVFILMASKRVQMGEDQVQILEFTQAPLFELKKSCHVFSSSYFIGTWTMFLDSDAGTLPVFIPSFAEGPTSGSFVFC